MGLDGYCLFLFVFTGFRLLSLDKGCLLVYNVRMQAVLIRVRKETREKLHAIKNPGQTLDGIITQMIDLWGKEKEKERTKEQWEETIAKEKKEE